MYCDSSFGYVYQEEKIQCQKPIQLRSFLSFILQLLRTNMLHQIALLATVTILGVLEQAYFAMQVIYARRKCKVSPPGVSGPPEFERIFRAQVNCSEYFPIFLSLLWVAGVFFHQGLAAFCGLIYLYARYQYFSGYAWTAQGRVSCFVQRRAGTKKVKFIHMTSKTARE
ncbi:leukotriene C4 synthase [Eublepharis macularius]|uniref:Leukotriene C4 synthase n=1 Tax=Eublepharis macularius TaxID=481883 RepID=A0AA97KUK1_EUBMA|nr:leukotriene C4 synthase [Eublepharis macularius]